MVIDKLHYISQQPPTGTHISSIETALKAGCKWIQLRVKDQPGTLVLEYALHAKTLCDHHGAKLIINDYPEIALRVGAYGFHLGLQDMPIVRAREIAGTQMIVGGTANTFQDIQQRAAEGADYIGLGPYRFTKTKKKLSPILGLGGYKDIIRQVRVAGIRTPIIAIGGIELDDISSIMATGVYGVAVSGAITYAIETRQCVADMYQRVKASSLNEA